LQSEITQLQLDLIRELIYKETGILYETKKDYALKARIERRIKATNSKNFREYQSLLKSNSEELQNLIEELTINETYFFRDITQLKGFSEKALPLVAEEKRNRNDFTLKIWSAACSTGEEPYTLSMLVQETIKDLSKWNIEVLATDIDRKVLSIAKKAEYGNRSVKNTPEHIKKKYFQQSGNYWRVLPKITRMVKFEHLNLMDRRAMRLKKGYDFIFCRNVLIYFDDNARKKVVNNFYDSLNPGGFLFLGSSESVGRITASFQLLKIDDFLFYRKPLLGRFK
jgi:chemotaxis protein methyltransferase CheR